MKKEHEAIKYRVALFDNPVTPYTVTADNEHQAGMCQNDPRFIEWVTGWKEVKRSKANVTMEAECEYGQ